MSDCFSKEKRSEIMSRIRSKNTKAEKIVFGELRRRNIYFQKHYSRIDGHPDLALPRKKLAVFIDGDFWHGRKQDASRLPKIYWQEKILKNIDRDCKINAMLSDKGWKVLRIWESDIIRKKTREDILNQLLNFLATE
jgi:DNA mismatch endonuclease (patch repair protein)